MINNGDDYVSKHKNEIVYRFSRENNLNEINNIKIIRKKKQKMKFRINTMSLFISLYSITEFGTVLLTVI